jgi:tRNA U55 pseudouridine synthase TruB
LTKENLAGHLLPALTAVRQLPRVELGDVQLTEIRHGRPIATPASATPTAEAVSPATGAAKEWVAVDAAGELVAILFEKYPGQLWPRVNFAS